MLETWNWYVSTNTYTVLENTVYLIPSRYWPFSGVFIVNFEHISQLVLVLLFSTLNMQLPAGQCQDHVSIHRRKSTFNQSNTMRTVLIFLVLFYVSVKRFIETLLVQIFMSILLLILKTVFIYPGLDQKSGNGKSPVWVSSNIWKLE